MTEREKMLAGLLYDCGDPELLDLWHRAKDLPGGVIAYGNPCRVVRENRLAES